MNRRRLIYPMAAGVLAGLLCVVIAHPDQRLAFAQGDVPEAVPDDVPSSPETPVRETKPSVTPPQETTPSVTYFGNRAQGWTKVPLVTIASQPEDPRIPLVLAAIDFWNGELTDMGSGFRIGEVSYSPMSWPDDDLAQRSAAIVDGQPVPPLPELAQGMAGDIIVVLSEADFVSFGGGAEINTRALVAISGNQPPRSLPNVMRNVIAHELGHAIGLGHNDDPSLLMCGRPAECRPIAFRSLVARMFPITDEERATLLRFYPPDWQPSR